MCIEKLNISPNVERLDISDTIRNLTDNDFKKQKEKEFKNNQIKKKKPNFKTKDLNKKAQEKTKENISVNKNIHKK